jgi:hypothetical protein
LYEKIEAKEATLLTMALVTVLLASDFMVVANCRKHCSEQHLHIFLLICIIVDILHKKQKNGAD